MSLGRNIELKARIAELSHTRRLARRVATECLGFQHQIDTYFHCRTGRLKLRQIDNGMAHLISYTRPDEATAKRSDYRLVPVTEVHAMRDALTAALGVRVEVEKRREIFLRENVRIHLDEVVGLGSFLEFEAVLDPQQPDAVGHQQLARLQQVLEIEPSHCVEGSYADLLADRLSRR